MFEVGDRVKCIKNPDANTFLELGKVYTIEKILAGFAGFVRLSGVEGGWMASRFVKVDSCSTEGTKYDTSKVRTDLVPVRAVLNAAEVFTFGAKKYGDRNWEKGIKNSRLYGACLRHLFAHEVGETMDPESNLPHLSHALCCVMMLVDNMKNRPAMDDRGVENV